MKRGVGIDSMRLNRLTAEQEFSAGDKRIETAISLAEMEAGFGDTPLPRADVDVSYAGIDEDEV